MLRMYAVATLVMCAPAFAQLHSGDIVLSTLSGRIETGSGLPSQGTFIEGRVFPATLPVTPPHFNSNPGFDCESGTFPAGSPVGFDLLSVLKRYDAGSGAYVDADGARLRVSFSTLAVISSTDPENPEVAGFAINADSSGVWHRHLTWWVQDASGSPAVAVDTGVYAIVVELWSGSGSIDRSTDFAMLFDVGASNEEVADAADAATALLTPDTIPGDVTGDMSVNFSDLNVVLVQFGQSGPGLQGDADGDGDVDFSDLNVVLVNFGTSAG